MAQNSSVEVPSFDFWKSMPGVFNPAESGLSGLMRGAVGAGMDKKHLTTIGLAADVPFTVGKNSFGTGVFFNRRESAEYKMAVGGINGALHFPLGTTSKLSIGILGGWAGINRPDSIASDYSRSGHGLFGAGVSLRAGPLETGLSFRSVTGVNTCFNFDISGNIKIEKTFIIRPTLLTVTDFSHLAAQGVLEAQWKRMISLGAGYMLKEGPVVTAGIMYKGLFANYTFLWHKSGADSGYVPSNSVSIGCNFALYQRPQSRGIIRTVRHMHPYVPTVRDFQK